MRHSQIPQLTNNVGSHADFSCCNFVDIDPIFFSTHPFRFVYVLFVHNLPSNFKENHHTGYTMRWGKTRMISVERRNAMFYSARFS